jgi:hypothetical protein
MSWSFKTVSFATKNIVIFFETRSDLVAETNHLHGARSPDEVAKRKVASVSGIETLLSSP